MKMRALGALCLLVAGLGAPAAATDEPIRICVHVPITGAAPIPHHPDRFGQFYFDMVNAEQDGIGGRPVQMVAVNDQYSPAGARAAAERCHRLGTDLYVGLAGVDQMVSVAKWAHAQQVPYLHGSMSRALSESLDGDASFGPTQDELAEGLANVLSANGSDLTGGPRPVFGMVVIDSPSFDDEIEAFRAALEERGHTLGPVIRLQKDENEFGNAYDRLQAAGVNIINMAVSPNLMLKMANQRPITYDPVFASSQPFMGSNLISSFIGNSRMLVLNDPAPAYNEDDPDPRWASEIEEFQRVFDTYSPEQNPRRDDFDWMAYLRAKQIHRMLLALDGNITPQGFFDLFESHQETPEASFPTCPLDFATDPTFGQRAWHVFQNKARKWVEVGFCADSESTTDLAPPRIRCEQVGVTKQTCAFEDRISGVAAVSITATPLTGEPVIQTGDGGCEEFLEVAVSLPTGVYRIDAQGSDCAGGQSTSSFTTIVV